LDNKNKHFQTLIQKYLNNTASSKEREAVEKYYELFEEEPPANELLEENEAARIESKIFEKINSEIKTSKREIAVWSLIRWTAVAAAIAGLAFFINISLQTENPTVSSIQVPEKAPYVTQVPYNQFLQLPDGTTVVLHGHSTLTYDENFNNKKREVTLIGEAYFDVKHNPNVPFVIHSGKLKTTVLGTSFNIKAWPEQKDIIVSVTRGKVKVENENKLVAILTQDKQVVYNVESDNADQHKVESELSISWIQSDMTFDNMSFENLAEHLSKRYNLDIIFQNEELKNCSFTGRFTGTESFDEVMKILSATSNTTYSVTGNQVVISGEKCI
jgi:transmembrane sensor